MTFQAYRRSYLAAVLLTVAIVCQGGCTQNRPPDLEPGALPIWQATEVQAAFGTLQRTAISLNSIRKEDGQSLLSDANTRTVIGVVTDVVLTLRAVPDGWQSTANAALLRLGQRLTPEGQAKLSAYLEMVRTVTEGL